MLLTLKCIAYPTQNPATKTKKQPKGVLSREHLLNEQAGAKLGQSKLKLEIETWFYLIQIFCKNGFEKLQLSNLSATNHDLVQSSLTYQKSSPTAPKHQLAIHVLLSTYYV